MRKKKRIIGIICATAIFTIAGAAVAGVSLASSRQESEKTTYKDVTVERGNLVTGVTESGSVVIGTITQEFELDALAASSGNSSSNSVTSGSSFQRTSDSSSGEGAGTGTAGGASEGQGNPSSGSGTSGGTSSGASGSASGTSSTVSAALEVEEVYVTTGQSIAQGDSLLKIAQESLEKYRKVLEDNVTDAELAVSEAELSAKTKKLEADYTYQENIANGSVAKEKYEAAIENLNKAVTQAQEKLEESAAKIADAQARAAAGEDVDGKLAEELSNYSSLEDELKTAKCNLSTKSITAKQEYEETMLNYNNASSLLAIETNGIEDETEEAREAVEEAREALETFQSCVGDGIIRAAYSGILLECGCAAGDTLALGTAVAVYGDANAVTMTVSVSQEDISAVTIGDTVEIKMTAYEEETFTGQVSSIETGSSSDSSTVSYDVTVLFTSEVSGLYADMTGNVTFVTKKAEDVLYVSNKAILNEGVHSYVRRKKSDGSTEKVQVETGFSDGISVEIKSGLSEGDTVLIEGKVTKE